MTKVELKAVVLNDIVSRKPGLLDPQKADVGKVVAKSANSFTVIWTSSALPAETFYDNNDQNLDAVELHQPNLH